VRNTNRNTLRNRTNRHTVRNTNRHTLRNTNRHTLRNTNRHTVRNTNRHTVRGRLRWHTSLASARAYGPRGWNYYRAFGSRYSWYLPRTFRSFGYRYYWGAYGRYCYWVASHRCWYYWCGTYGTYLPVSMLGGCNCGAVDQVAPCEDSPPPDLPDDGGDDTPEPPDEDPDNGQGNGQDNGNQQSQNG
jgi:hypothetical protein